MKEKKMTGECLQFMQDNQGKYTDTEISKRFGFSRVCIAYYRRMLGFKPKCRKLSYTEIEYIREHYRVDKTGVELAKELGMELTNFYARVKKLGFANDKTRNKR